MSSAVRHRVLLVDDDQAIRRLVGTVLQRAGYEVDFAEDGGAGLTKALARDYDLLVVDQEMPVRNGRELLEHLAQSGPLPPTIVLTGHGSEELAVELMKLGACDYISKTAPAALTEMLPLALARAVAQHELRLQKQQAEAALRQSQQLLLATLESTADGILAVTTDGKVLTYNRRFLQMWRIPEHVAHAATNGALIQHVLDQLEAPHAFLTSIEQTLRSATDKFDTLHFKDGRVFERYSSPLTMDGKIIGRVWNFRDVTERHQVEQQLRKRSEELSERLRELHCLFEVSRLFENPELSIEQLVCKALELILTAFRDPQAISARCVLEGKVHQLTTYEETQWKLAAPVMGGERLLGAIEVCRAKDPPSGEAPFLDEEASLLNTLGEMLGRQIVRLRAEAEVRRLKQQIEYILGATNTNLRIIDTENNIHYVNPTWQQQLGDPQGKKCYQHFANRAQPCSDCGAVKALTDKQVVVTEQTLGNEDQRVYQVSTVPFQDESGRWMVAEVCTDITERKKMESQLAQAQRLEAIAHLASGVAHELNTPIQYISDNVRFLRDAFSHFQHLLHLIERSLDCDEQHPSWAEKLAAVRSAIADSQLRFLLEQAPVAAEESLEGAMHMAGIVQALKEFAQPSGSDRQTTEIGRAIDTTLSICRSRWTHVAEIVLCMEPDLPPVACNPADFNQVILQLVVNAAQAIAAVPGASHGKSKGTITITARSDGPWLELSVTDTGIGIPPEIQSKIFDPFFTTREVGQGSGQGLSLVYAIVVKKHGGSITFDTQPGRGTSFVVRLPLAQQPVEAAVS